VATPVLVVAQYQEPSWQVDPLLGFEVQRVVKDLDVPNEGRETASFFWWMWQNRHVVDPDTTYTFLQGDPWVHGILPRNFRPVSRYTPLGTYRVECAWDGSPHHPGLPLERLWWKWQIADERPPTLKFVAGGQFMIPGSEILKRDAGHYYWMYQQQREEELAPWCMERFWPSYWKAVA